MLSEPSNQGRNPDEPPSVAVWLMERDRDGLSTIGEAWIDGFAQQSVGGAAAAMWMRALPASVTKIWLSLLPVGWVGEWHESPAPQWVVPLSGRWFIETQDGARVEMGPGEIHWGTDIGTTELNGGRGHRSGQIGDVPCVQLMVQFAPGTAVPDFNK